MMNSSFMMRKGNHGNRATIKATVTTIVNGLENQVGILGVAPFMLKIAVTMKIVSITTIRVV